MKLTDTQLVLLSAASQREDCGIELARNLRGGAAQKLVRKLLTEGLIEEVLAAGSLPVWRRDEDKGPLALRITQRGLAAIRSTRAARWRSQKTQETEQRADRAPGKSSRRAASRRKKTRDDTSPTADPARARIRSRTV
jgi:hypothetical protein